MIIIIIIIIYIYINFAVKRPFQSLNIFSGDYFNELLNELSKEKEQYFLLVSLTPT